MAGADETENDGTENEVGGESEIAPAAAAAAVAAVEPAIQPAPRVRLLRHLRA
jgi:hypothetical protein